MKRIDNIILKFNEYLHSDFNPLDSFKIKDILCDVVWNETNDVDDGNVTYIMNPNIREKLLKLSYDFFKTTKLDIEIKDIILTGSLANYNWSNRYSDFDIHILVDFSEASNNIEFVKNYVDMAKNIWNKENDIKIGGFDTEVYIQDINEHHTSTGTYSILNNKWINIPTKKNFIPDELDIKLKSEPLMYQIDELSFIKDNMSYDEFINVYNSIFDKIRKYRKSGLEESGEYSTGNLVFKLLRRNGYISKLIEMKKLMYIKQYD